MRPVAHAKKMRRGGPQRGPAAQRRERRLIPDLRSGEGVVLLRRQHPAVLFWKLIWPVLLLLAWIVAGSLFVVPYISSLDTDPLLSPGRAVPAWLPIALWVAWLGVAVVGVLWASFLVLDWSDDWFALTTRRIITMEKRLFLYESRREVPVSKVQNVTAEYPHLLGTTFDFGHLKVDTAGVGLLVFENLPRPKEVRDAIFAQQKALDSNQPSPEARRKEAVINILGAGGPTIAPHTATLHKHPPTAQPTEQKTVSGYNGFNLLFPFVPQRADGGVTWHKHWIFLIKALGWPFFVYGTAVGGLLLALGSSNNGVSSLAGDALGWVLVLLTPMCAAWAVWNWEDWRNDLYKLDKDRVYSIESLPFGFREQAKETTIARVTDVQYIVPGPLANMLNYGTVVIKTPGESTEFAFKGVPCPRQVQQEIMARVDAHRKDASVEVDEEIEAWLKAYHDVTRGA